MALLSVKYLVYHENFMKPLAVLLPRPGVSDQTARVTISIVLLLLSEWGLNNYCYFQHSPMVVCFI